MDTNTTRRNFLRIGTTAAAYAAGTSIVTGGIALASQAKGAALAGVSPKLTALIAAVGPRKAAVERHQRDVLDRPAFEGQDNATRLCEVDDNNRLNDAWCDAIDAVAYYPATTARDLHAKLAFMVENQMGDGRDWTEELFADAARIAGVGAWS